MTPEQIERRRKNSRERAARHRAKVKDTPAFKAKRKLAIENFTEKQREQVRKNGREHAARQRAKDPEKLNAYKREHWANSDKGGILSCRYRLAVQLGVFRKDVPDELVEAKFAQLKVRRLVRDLG